MARPTLGLSIICLKTRRRRWPQKQVAGRRVKVGRWCPVERAPRPACRCHDPVALSSFHASTCHCLLSPRLRLDTRHKHPYRPTRHYLPPSTMTSPPASGGLRMILLTTSSVLYSFLLSINSLLNQISNHFHPLLRIRLKNRGEIRLSVPSWLHRGGLQNWKKIESFARFRCTKNGFWNLEKFSV